VKIKPIRHLARASGWRKFEPLWNRIIRVRRADWLLPLVEKIGGFDEHPPDKSSQLPVPKSPALEFLAAEMYDR